MVVDHLAVAVEIQNGGGVFIGGIEATAYGNILFYRYLVVGCTGRRWRPVFTRIEDESENMRLVEQGIVHFARHGKAILTSCVDASTSKGTVHRAPTPTPFEVGPIRVCYNDMQGYSTGIIMDRELVSNLSNIITAASALAVAVIAFFGD
ncbi:MAG: hypothetical protein A2169_00535 [Deltaproteobacteria bacterium RBG_13_47_9]|nr:MAG: hypothetical protein A2169_00535 [Deltaproteobacteria bacterium RBG_13_47_9]